MHSNSTFQKVKALIDRYNTSFAQKGIVCTVSRKYIESHVSSHNAQGIEYFFCEKEEKKKYMGQNNRYYVIVIRFSPKDKNIIKKADCKEYAFITRKIERAHIGLKPEETLCKEKKLLNKIERRLHKVLEKSHTQDLIETCKDGFCDFFRYMFSVKYDHKNFLFGKPRSFWYNVFGITELGVLILFLLFAWLYTVL